MWSVLFSLSTWQPLILLYAFKISHHLFQHEQVLHSLFSGILSIKDTHGLILILICFDLVQQIRCVLQPDVAWELFIVQDTAECAQQQKYKPKLNTSQSVITGEVPLSYSAAKPNCVSNMAESSKGVRSITSDNSGETLPAAIYVIHCKISGMLNKDSPCLLCPKLKLIRRCVFSSKTVNYFPANS